MAKTKLGRDVNKVEKKMIKRSGSLFLVKAAKLPNTRPKASATRIAIPPSLADTWKDSKIRVLISRPVLVEIPKSP